MMPGMGNLGGPSPLQPWEEFPGGDQPASRLADFAQEGLRLGLVEMANCIGSHLEVISAANELPRRVCDADLGNHAVQNDLMHRAELIQDCIRIWVGEYV